jgi:nucleoside-diphosphate-sugar epimerase
MKIVVIGATGHVGGYLIPRLVADGHDVVGISRNPKPIYRDDPAWSQVEMVRIDRQSQDAAGTFGRTIADLGADVVIDMICFSRESAEQLVDALRGNAQHLVMCTTIWVKGTLTTVPASEDDVSTPWGDYGQGKAAIEELLMAEGERDGGLRSTCLRPGHISGPGWEIINPQANFALRTWEQLAEGETLTLPNFGLETVHHVHADDVAQAFQRAISRVGGARAERFNVVSEQSLTLRGFAEAVSAGFGQQSRLHFSNFEYFAAGLAEDVAATSRDHISRSHTMSIEKARSELGYSPAYSSLEAVAEAVNWLRDHDLLHLGGRHLVVS